MTDDSYTLMSLPYELVIHIMSNVNCIQDLINCIVNTHFKCLIFRHTHLLRLPYQPDYYINVLSLCRFYNLRHIKGPLLLSHPKDVLKFVSLHKLAKVKFIFPTYTYSENMFYESVYEYIKNTRINFAHSNIVFDYTYEFAGIDFKESIHIKQNVLYIFGSDPQFKFTKFGIDSGKFHQIIYGSFYMFSTFKDLLHSYTHKIKLVGDFDTGISSIVIYN